MRGSTPAGSSAGGWERRRRLAVVLWLVFGFVVWNATFDATVIQGGRSYLRAQTMHMQGQGPPAAMRDVMAAAVTRGVWLASAFGGGVMAVGLLGVWVASRRRAASLPGMPG